MVTKLDNHRQRQPAEYKPQAYRVKCHSLYNEGRALAGLNITILLLQLEALVSSRQVIITYSSQLEIIKSRKIIIRIMLSSWSKTTWKETQPKWTKTASIKYSALGPADRWRRTLDFITPRLKMKSSSTLWSTWWTWQKATTTMTAHTRTTPAA